MRILSHLQVISKVCNVESFDLPKFHRRPDVDNTVESIPTGNRPQVGPNNSWSMDIR